MAHLLPRTPITTLDEYLATDVGGLGLQRAVELGPAGTIDEIGRAGLRGRGGGGFPTARKWAGVRAQPGTVRYVVANAAEGEPGTFKDRALLRANPYQFVEGLFVAAHAVGAIEAFVGLKASFTREIAAVERAVVEMQQAGICADCRVVVVRGPEEYLFGEETGLLEVIEGNEPLPRVLRPHEHGLFATAPQLGWESTESEPGRGGPAASNPTVVNNVETLANVPHVLARGGDWFRRLGTEASPGTQVCTVVGAVRRAGVAEMEMGTPLRSVIDEIGGGVPDGRRIKAVFSGVANAVITADRLDAPLSYEGLAAVGSGLGSAGFIVHDDSACMVRVALAYSRFLYVESCAQCPACKRGTGEITRLLELVERGGATSDHVEEMGGWLAKVTDGNRCYLPVEEQALVASVLRAFPDEFAEHLERGGCPRPGDEVLVPKLVDLEGAVAVEDGAQRRKRPDWTYAPAHDAP